VSAYIERERQRGPLHFTLLDPDKQSPAKAGELARAAAEAGSHAIMVGGSTGLNMRLVDATVLAIKRRVEVPVILFPPGAEGISAHADAVFWMSMLNSRSRRFLIDEQRIGAPFVKHLGLEPLAMAYLVFEPGGAAGMVGEADLIPRDDPATAIGYALAAQYFGMEFVYLEAGSGAAAPIPAEVVAAVRRELDIPLIVGGGIRDRHTARTLIEAGADIIVTGTLIEGLVDVKGTLSELLDYIRGIVRRGVDRLSDEPATKGSSEEAPAIPVRAVHPDGETGSRAGAAREGP
jgi:phosphoglycerol geranylgeranyltransferase